MGPVLWVLCLRTGPAIVPPTTQNPTSPESSVTPLPSEIDAGRHGRCRPQQTPTSAPATENRTVPLRDARRSQTIVSRRSPHLHLRSRDSSSPSAVRLVSPSPVGPQSASADSRTLERGSRFRSPGGLLPASALSQPVSASTHPWTTPSRPCDSRFNNKPHIVVMVCLRTRSYSLIQLIHVCRVPQAACRHS